MRRHSHGVTTGIYIKQEYKSELLVLDFQVIFKCVGDVVMTMVGKRHIKIVGMLQELM